MNTLERLADDLAYRNKLMYSQDGVTIDKRNKAYRIAETCPTWIIEFTYGSVLRSIEQRATIAAVVKAIGTAIMRKEKLAQDAVEACHIGWHVLKAYFETGILGYRGEFRKNPKTNKRDKHKTYYLVVKDLPAIQELIGLINSDNVELFPSSTPPGDWENNKFIHEETGYQLIKHPHEAAIAAVKHNDMSYLVETLNKLNNTGWRINNFVFDVYKECKHNQKPKSPFKFAKEVDREKISKLKTIVINHLKIGYYYGSKKSKICNSV